MAQSPKIEDKNEKKDETEEGSKSASTATTTTTEQTQVDQDAEQNADQKESEQPKSQTSEDENEKDKKDDAPQKEHEDLSRTEVAEMRAKIKNLLVGQDSYIANKLTKTIQNNYYGASDVSFSRSMVEPISVEQEREDADVFVHDEKITQELLSKLREKRLMILMGDPEIGKARTALHLCNILRSENGVSLDETYLINSLERNVRIDLSELVSNGEEFGNRILVFQDAFARGNRAILEFFKYLGNNGLKSISARLRKNEMYLIFTADSVTVSHYDAQISKLDIQAQLAPPSEELLETGLLKRLQRFADRAGKTLDDIEKVLSADEKKRLIKVGRTMPHIAEFVDRHLKSVISGDLNLEQALNRISYDLKHWFLTELADDFEVWCFAFTLGLCQRLPYSNGISWFEFEHLRNAISKGLRRKMRLPLQQTININDAVSEDLYLKRCRAEIQRDQDSGAAVLRYIDEQYSEKLWDIFVTYNRKALTIILPYLNEMAEGSNIAMRVQAARIIGRIGELDPPNIIYTLINEWVRSEQPNQQAIVGYLYQGILASKNKQYREGCLNLLRNMANSEKDELWTAIAAYKQIGVFDLSLAMKELQHISERKFTEKIIDTQRIEKILNRIENALRDKPLDDTGVLNLAVYHEVLREIALRTFSQELGILFAIQYAIVSLCLALGPVQVFEELCHWMTADKKALAALISLLFLQEDGIADELESWMVEVSSDINTNAQAQQCNLIVVSVASSETAVPQMAKFLTAIFDSFSTFFPPRSGRYLRKSFLLHLKKWAKNAVSVQKCRDGMEQLFTELLQKPNKELYLLLYNFLNTDSDFTNPDSKLNSFADAVIKRCLNGTSKPYLFR